MFSSVAYTLTCARSRDDAELAGDIDHGPPLPRMLRQRLLLQHLPQRSSGREPHSLAVDVHDGVVRAHRRLRGAGVASEYARAINRVIHATKGLCRLGHERVDERLVRDIPGSERDVCVLVNSPEDLAGVGEGVGVDVGDGEPGASGLYKGRGDCGADA